MLPRLRKVSSSSLKSLYLTTFLTILNRLMTRHITCRSAMQALISKNCGPIGAVIEGNLKIQTYLDEIKKRLIEKQPEVAEFVSVINSSLRKICDASVDISDIVLPR